MSARNFIKSLLAIAFLATGLFDICSFGEALFTKSAFAQSGHGEGDHSDQTEQHDCNQVCGGHNCFHHSALADSSIATYAKEVLLGKLNFYTVPSLAQSSIESLFRPPRS